MAKILYVVHRYAPFPGGSEYNTQRMAESSKSLGHEVVVLSPTNQGDYNGIKVVSDFSVLETKWDAIIVHGDASAQNTVHQLGDTLNSPILYLMIRAHDDPIVRIAMKNAKWIGCATSEDRELVDKLCYNDKRIDIDYSIGTAPVLDRKTAQLKEKFSVSRDVVYLSCGGFAPHKGFSNLVEAFCKLQRDDVELVLAGYDLGHGFPDYIKYGIEHNKKIQAFYLENPADVYELMSISDLLIWNSEFGSEGYGLVLLESMYMKCNWIGKDMVMGHDLHAAGFGKVYKTNEELLFLLEEFQYNEDEAIKARKYIEDTHLQLNTTKKMLELIGI